MAWNNIYESWQRNDRLDNLEEDLEELYAFLLGITNE